MEEVQGGETTITTEDISEVFQIIGIGKRIRFEYKCDNPNCQREHQITGTIYGADMATIRIREVEDNGAAPEDAELLTCVEYIFFRGGGFTVNIIDPEKFMRLQAKSVAYANPFSPSHPKA